MSGLPIRLRVTLAFACIMALVLGAIGFAVYLRFESQLDHTINQGLRTRADELRPLLADRRTLLSDAATGSPLVEQSESFAQILRPDRTVLTATAKLGSRPLLSAAQLARARRGTILIDRDSPFERGEPVRLLATPFDADGSRVVAVVGTATDDRRDALRTLALLLALGGAAALALASAAGFRVAAAALRPVEAMRRKAHEITADAPGERLPIAPGDDEIARLGTTLNDMLARLEGSLERERGFVADAGHELRTPLAILRTELELALREGRTPDELRAALRSATEETDRLAQLAEALLVIAGAGRDGLALVRTDLRASAVLEGVNLRFASRVEGRKRALVVDLPADASFAADPRRLEQALDNLVENALRHGAGTIRLGARADNGCVTLTVRDEGPGFPPQFIGYAFERFTRADHAHGRGGSGLGLSIVQVIARAHGGEARAANHAEGGAELSIELPRAG